MRKLIMWNIVTLDGYFEGDQKWDLPFHNVIWGEELEKFSVDQLQNTGYLVFGRITYEGMAAYWTKAEGEIAQLMNSLPKIVCSNTLPSAAWNNTLLLKKEELVEKINALKAEGGKDLFVFGSANLSQTFMSASLFDEYRIAVAPVILGSGKPLFPQGTLPRHLCLESVQQLRSGGVIMRYTKLNRGSGPSI